jgi:hypothetical protein
MMDGVLRGIRGALLEVIERIEQGHALHASVETGCQVTMHPVTASTKAHRRGFLQLRPVGEPGEQVKDEA